MSDKKIPHTTNGTTIDYYNADVVTANDYYPFGFLMPGRKYAANNTYRYGFNGKENDNEVKGEGNEQDYGMRIYDPRLGKFLSVDPLTKNFPSWSPYPFAMNDVIRAIDLDGTEKKIITTNIYINSSNGSTVINRISEKDVDNPYKLGGGILYQTRIFRTNPETGVSEISDIPYYEAEKIGFVQGIINAVKNFGKKVWNSGFVVFGSCNTGDCMSSGSTGDNGNVLGVIDMGDKDTKEVMDMIMLTPSSTPPVGQDEAMLNIPDVTNEISKDIMDEKAKLEPNVTPPPNSSPSTTTANTKQSTTQEAKKVTQQQTPKSTPKATGNVKTTQVATYGRKDSIGKDGSVWDVPTLTPVNKTKKTGN